MRNKALLLNVTILQVYIGMPVVIVVSIYIFVISAKTLYYSLRPRYRISV